MSPSQTNLSWNAGWGGCLPLLHWNHLRQKCTVTAGEHMDASWNHHPTISNGWMIVPHRAHFVWTSHNKSMRYVMWQMCANVRHLKGDPSKALIRIWGMLCPRSACYGDRAWADQIRHATVPPNVNPTSYWYSFLCAPSMISKKKNVQVSMIEWYLDRPLRTNHFSWWSSLFLWDTHFIHLHPYRGR